MKPDRGDNKKTFPVSYSDVEIVSDFCGDRSGPGSIILRFDSTSVYETALNQDLYS